MNVRLMKIVSGFIVFIFVVTNINPVGYANMPKAEVSLAPFKTLEIPAEFGQVTDMFAGSPGAPALIHIQSAHGNFSAEKNIENLLGLIEKKSKVRLMLLEGAAEKLQPELFRLFPEHPEFNRKVTDKLMQEGYLTGPESFLIESAKKTEGWGVEDLDAYRRDRDAFIKVVKADKKTQDFLLKRRADLSKRFTSKLGKDLVTFIRQEEAFDSGALTFEAWLKALASAAEKNLRLDLSDVYNQIDWPYLVRYERLRAIGSKIDAQKAREEAGSFLKGLEARKVSKDIISNFRSLLAMSEADLFKAAGRSVDAYSPLRLAFDRAFGKLPKDFSMKPWPNWALYAQYAILTQELDGKGLHEETARLKEKILNALAQTPHEKKYVTQTRQLNLLRKLFALELTREEYESLRWRSSFNELIESDIKPVYEQALDFYSTAVVREEKMFTNALKRMSEQKQKRAVLVTGGFHADGLKRLAVSQGLSYMQITPRIEEVSKRDHEVYLRSILGARGFETSQMSALLSTDPGSMKTVLGAELKNFLNGIRKLVADLISVEPVSVQPVLQAELDGSAVLGRWASTISVSTPLRSEREARVRSEAREVTARDLYEAVIIEINKPNFEKKNGTRKISANAIEHLAYNLSDSVGGNTVIDGEDLRNFLRKSEASGDTADFFSSVFRSMEKQKSTAKGSKPKSKAVFQRSEARDGPAAQAGALSVGALFAKVARLKKLIADSEFEKSVRRLRALTEKQIQALTEGQIQALTKEQIQALTKEQIQALTKEQIQALTWEQIQALTWEQIKTLAWEQIKTLAWKQIKALAWEQIQALFNWRIPVLTKKQIQALTEGQIQALTKEQIQALTKKQIEVLAPKQIQALTWEQIQVLTKGQIQALTKKQIKALTKEQIQALTWEQIQALTKEQIPALTRNQILTLTWDHIQALTNWERVQALTEKQKMWWNRRLDQLMPVQQKTISGVRSEARASEPIGAEGSREFYKKIAAQGNVIVMSVNMRSKFMLRGIFRAAKQTNAPVIIQRSISEFVAGYKVEDLARDAKEAAEAEGYTGDWMLKLDHGTITEYTEAAVQKVIGFVEAAKAAGYGSFSIDASKLVQFEKPTVEEQQARNIEVTARIVKETGIQDAAWEGEIGEIVGDHNELSTPEEAVAFIKGIEQQGVREPVLLAINNGSEHGNASDMKINLERTSEIVEAIAPWGVLINQHGITGTPLTLFAAIAEAKIINGNVGTHWQNIMWSILATRRLDIMKEAFATFLPGVDLDAAEGQAVLALIRAGKGGGKAAGKPWDKTVRKFEPRLNELLANDPETVEAIAVAIAESGVEHFTAFGSKSPSLVGGAMRSEVRDAEFPKEDPSMTPAWAVLEELAIRGMVLDQRKLFEGNSSRAAMFSVDAGSLHLDYSKNLIDGDIRFTLTKLAEQTGLPEGIEAMFNGVKINNTENRAVLHTALRNIARDSSGKLIAASGPVYVDGKDVMPDVIKVLEKMKGFTEQIIGGDWKGYTGKSITDVVNIGIGGSDLGPNAIYETLKPYTKGKPRVHFVANVDGSHAADILEKLDAETTLFVIASKTFTTQETIKNAETAKNWFLERASYFELFGRKITDRIFVNAATWFQNILNHFVPGNFQFVRQDKSAVAKHFVAVSTAKDKVEAFGIDPANMFEFWDWVGGRYSVWSAIGLSLACGIGFDNFEEFLKGGNLMDRHFRETKNLERNMPVIMALINIWNINFLGARSRVIAAYDQHLHRFTAHLQQVDMESNGKSVDRNGERVTYQTGVPVFGEAGTNAQHSYFQELHQGTEPIPVDFILAARRSFRERLSDSMEKILDEHHELLKNNAIAQAAALAFGKTLGEAMSELLAKGMPEEQARKIAPFKTFEGNRPSNFVMVTRMTPRAAGELLALYENKIFVEGWLWNINSYDQMGVELGKENATGIEKGEGPKDSSTQSLLELSRMTLSSAFEKPQAQRSEMRNIEIYAQHFSMKEGAATGSVNREHLLEVGVNRSLVGHSERRRRDVEIYNTDKNSPLFGTVSKTYPQYGDTDEAINAKLKLAAQGEGFQELLCVGEPRSIRDDGMYIQFILKQLEMAFWEMNEADAAKAVSMIAYEPIWAINTGLTATPEQAQEVQKAMREWLAQRFSPGFAANMRILYGGSAKPETVEGLLAQPDIDGFLVGGASLKLESFAEMGRKMAAIGDKGNGRTPVLAANWKAEKAAKRTDIAPFVSGLAAEEFSRQGKVQVIVAPPHTLLKNAVTAVNLAAEREISSGTVKVAINGFGRIGGNVMRALLQSPYDIEIVGINDLALNLGKNGKKGTGALAEGLQNEFESLARSKVQNVKFDHGQDETGYWISINNGNKIRLSDEKDPAKLPWAELGVDIVLESTGRFTTKDDAAKHIQAGAKQVIITAPGKGGVMTVAPGVNHDIITKNLQEVSSCASCTTNAIASPMKVLNDALEIDAFSMDTIHAATNDQAMLNLLRPDAVQRGRQLEGNIIPTTTGAASAIGEVVPALKGKGDGIAERVPTANGSFVAVTMAVKKATTKDEVNGLLREASEGPMKGVLAYTERDMVSKDILGRHESSIVNGQYTTVMPLSTGGSLVTIRTWYDNEFGYSNRLVDLIAIMAGVKPSVQAREGVTQIRQAPAFVEAFLAGRSEAHLMDIFSASAAGFGTDIVANLIKGGAMRSEARASEPIGAEGSREFYKKIAAQGNVIVMSVNMRSKFMLRGIFRAAKQTNAPVIIQRSISEFVAGYKVEDLARDAKEAAEAEGYTGDWMLKLDHGTIVEDTEAAVQKVIGFVEAAKAAGYGSFSIDASKLVQFEKPTVEEQQARNIEVTARIVKETGIQDAAWEGEIGEIVGDHNELSTPEEAVAFIKGIEQQGVREPVLLAINNGSEHGNASDMKINLERTIEIVKAIAPWGVLINQHGITGTPLTLFAAIAEAKIINGNVGTHWQNIMWSILATRRLDIMKEAFAAFLPGVDIDTADGRAVLGLIKAGKGGGKAAGKPWDKTVRKFEPRLNELLANDQETVEAIAAAIAESGVEHFNAFGSKSPSLEGGAMRSEARTEAALPALDKDVYFIGTGHMAPEVSEVVKNDFNGAKEVLGGKGAGLAKMVNMGLPVPPAFTITTEVTKQYFKKGNQFPEGLQEKIDAMIALLETVTGKGFGDPKNPLLLSGRSGAKVSMPGMMDTILNLGLNDVTVKGLAEQTGDLRFVLDSYRRLLQMYGETAMGVSREKLTHVFNEAKKAKGLALNEDNKLDVEDLQAVIRNLKVVIFQEAGREFPQDPKEQLRGAIEAVFRSSNNEQANIYRRMNGIPKDVVSAVNVQSMAFGNMGETSATGVLFSRDTSSGENRINGEFLINAQGEDVVAGIRKGLSLEDLKNFMPEIYDQLIDYAKRLEKDARNAQDIEFTIEKGKLWMLQTRDAKRTAAAMVRMAVEMVGEGLITKEEALMRVDLARVEKDLMHPTVDPKAAKKATLIAKGVDASPGAAVGQIVLDSKRAADMKKRNPEVKVMLVREETSPEDLGGMEVSEGILTKLGGNTSHAALVARGQGIPAVVGVGALDIDYEAGTVTVNGKVYKEGDWLTIDGSSGKVYAGKVATMPSEIDQVQSGKMEPEESIVYQNYAKLLEWADEIRRLETWANADTPEDARKARELGAQGIGLTRTEHMFTEAFRVPLVQAMFLSEEGSEAREKILKKISEMQEEDFKGILVAMEGLPVTIRLLDPPMHEFLPQTTDTERIKAIAKSLEITEEEVVRKINAAHEINPMLGRRGVRLGLMSASIYRMQVQAMVRAYARNLKNGSWTPLKIMVPNIAEAEEMKQARELIEAAMNEILDEEGLTGDERDIAIGAMIETPSAALLSDEIAEYADFFSFGTNDLTQFIKALSRDDAAKSFLPFYIEHGIFKNDPTQKLDAKTVYRLVRTSVLEGRSVKPDLSIGICGEHGGEPESVGLFDQAGLSYVSASPLRIPIARLAAAQSTIRIKNNQFTVEEKAIAGGAASLEAHLVNMLSASFTAFGMNVAEMLVAKMAASLVKEVKEGGAMRSEAGARGSEKKGVATNSQLQAPSLAEGRGRSETRIGLKFGVTPEFLAANKHRMVAIAMAGGEGPGMNDFYAGVARSIEKLNERLSEDQKLILVAPKGGIKGYIGPNLHERIAVLDEANIKAANMDFKGGIAPGTTRIKLLGESDKNLISLIENMSGFRAFVSIGGGDHAPLWKDFKNALETKDRFKKNPFNEAVRSRGIDIVKRTVVNFKTIDLDVPGAPIGGAKAIRDGQRSFYSRVTSHEAMNKIQTVRIMGEKAGTLAVMAGGRKPMTLGFMESSASLKHQALASTIKEHGKEVLIVLPEVPVTLEEIVAKVRDIYEKFGTCTVLVSEAANILVDRKPEPELEQLFQKLSNFREQLDVVKSRIDETKDKMEKIKKTGQKTPEQFQELERLESVLKALSENWEDSSDAMQGRLVRFIDQAMKETNYGLVLKAFMAVPVYFTDEGVKGSMLSKADESFRKMSPSDKDPLLVRLLARSLGRYFDSAALGAFHKRFNASRDPHGNPKVAETTPEGFVDAAIRRSLYREHPDPAKRKDKNFSPRAPEQIGYDLRGAQANMVEKLKTLLLAEKDAELIHNGETERAALLSPFVELNILDAMGQVDRSGEIKWGDEQGYIEAAMKILRTKNLVQVKSLAEVSKLLKDLLLELPSEEKEKEQFHKTINALHWWSPEELEEQGVLIPSGYKEHGGMAAKRELFHKFIDSFPSVASQRSETRAEEVLPEAEWAAISKEELAIKRAFGTNGIRSDDINLAGQQRITAGAAAVLAAQWRKDNPGQVLPAVMVGFDPRPQGVNGFVAGEMGESKAIAETMAAYGFKVLFVAKPLAAPFMISATGKDVHPANVYAAVMRTASHNEVVDPKSGQLVSGFKLFMNNAPAPDSLTGLISAKINDAEFAAQAPRLDFETAVREGKIVVVQDGTADDPDTVEMKRMKEAFDLEKIGQDFRAKFPGFKIALNTMNGGLSKVAPEALKEMGFVGGGDFRAFNTTFMNDQSIQDQMMGFVDVKLSTSPEIRKVRYAPDPTRWWMRGKEYTDFVSQNPAQTIAFLIDGDGDRLVAELEKEIVPNEIGMLAAYYLAHYKGQKGHIVRTVPTISGLDALSKALSMGHVDVTPVGSKWFAGPNKYYDGTLNEILVAVEESGHIGFRKNGQLFFDHSIGLATLMLEMMAETGKTWQELSDEMWAFIKEKTGQERIMTVRDGIGKDEGAEKYYGLVARLGKPTEESFRHEFGSKMEGALAKEGLSWKVNDFDITDAGGAQLQFNGGRRLFPRKSGTDGSVRLYIEVLEADLQQNPELARELVKVMREVMDSFIATPAPEAGKIEGSPNRSEARAFTIEQPEIAVSLPEMLNGLGVSIKDMARTTKEAAGGIWAVAVVAASKAKTALVNLVTGNQRSEVLAEKSVVDAKRVLPRVMREAVMPSDVLVLGREFFLKDHRAAAGMRKVFSETTLAVIVSTDAERALLEDLNLHLRKEGLKEILAVGATNSGELKAHLKNIPNAVVRPVLYGAETIPEALKQQLPDLNKIIVTQQMFNGFVSAVDALVSGLVSDMQAKFAMAKSA